MTLHDFKNELREGVNDLGFKRGTRVTVNGRIGTVTTKLVRSPTDALQSVKFDEPDEAGKLFGSFPHTALELAAPVEGKPSEVDLLGQAIRRT